MQRHALQTCTAPPTRDATRIEFVHVLRGVAAGVVVLYHYLSKFWKSQAAIATYFVHVPPLDASVQAPVAARLFDTFLQQPFHPINYGEFGVALFFLISGFVIPLSLRRTAAPGFLLSRFVRLWPTYAAGVTLVVASLAAAARLDGAPFPLAGRTILANYCLGLREWVAQPNIDGIVWTLEIELKFYAVLAACAPLVRAGRSTLFAVAGTPLVAIVLAYTVAARTGAVTGTAASVAQYVAMNAGYILYMLVGTAINFVHAGTMTVHAAVQCGAALFCLSTAADFLIAPYDTAAERTFTHIKATAFFVVCYVCRHKFDAVRHSCLHPALTQLANVSYSLYATHAVMGYCVMNVTVRYAHWHPDAAVAAAFAAATLAAWGVHRFVEAPSQRLSSAVSRRWRLDPAAPATLKRSILGQGAV